MLSDNFLNPSFNIEFSDLYNIDGLKKIDQKFSEFLKQKNLNCYQQFLVNKNNNSQLLIEVAKSLEEFLVNLFLIEEQNSFLKLQHKNFDIVYEVKKEYISRSFLKKFSASDFNKALAGKKILKQLNLDFTDLDQLEIDLAQLIYLEINRENQDQKIINLIENYCLWALFSEDGQLLHINGNLFNLPQKTNKKNLLTNIDCTNNEKIRGFDLIDQGFSLNQIHGQAKYCIHCHKQNKDSCRTGLIDKNTAKIKIDELGIKLSGCPLQQKISEMNLLKSQGFTIASLAIAIIDNPMIAGTGSRICNDCMKACIFQNQDSVDIPQIETRIVKDVLHLPYGFEIYSLLTRWNPLNLSMPMMKSDSGKKILVCGVGPAGYTLAHYLLNLGHEVVAIDGLKIEPLQSEISGRDHENNLTEFKAIKDFSEIYEELSKRTIAGFGGVAEYGITVRYDKNFLKVIRILLMRRANFQLYGGIRFGSTITDKIAFENYQFNHIALCIGAGRPHILNLKNNFAKGVRLASDFLMALQLGGAYQKNLFSNLQIRSPIVVIGGGLTAIDSATEAKAYYDSQLKIFYEKFIKIFGEDYQTKNLEKYFNDEELLIIKEFIASYQELTKINKSCGNVKILYRKNLIDSPAYRQNHLEVKKALEQGVEFIENCEVEAIIVDQFNSVKALKTKDQKIIECRSLIIAIGTSPNLSIIYEDNLGLKNDQKYLLPMAKQFAVNNLKNKLLKENIGDELSQLQFINQINPNTLQAISFFGDLHQDYEGSVVKAMASAKKGVMEIEKILSLGELKYDTANNKPLQEFDYRKDFLVKILKINRLSENVVEVVVKAKLQALQTQVGQIFRLQNYRSYSSHINDQHLVMEGIAITALSIDLVLGIITGIVVETGGSTSLIKNFKENEPCVFMGPSGKPTEIAKNETVVFIGGGRGNQPLTALAEEFSKNGCKVIFFAGYRQASYIVNLSRMKKSCQQLILAVEEGGNSKEFFHGNVIEAIKDFFQKNPQPINRIFTIGSDNLMHEIAKLRHQNLVKEFAQAQYAIASLNAPMQCMMKGVCAQCLQKKTNKLGETEYFYCCANQDQPIDEVDFEHLHSRCQQNSVLEKINRFWLEYIIPNPIFKRTKKN
ncbi:MAG: FAD-dependent oxidoreductase [Alphaproteobacteria bacterium]